MDKPIYAHKVKEASFLPWGDSLSRLCIFLVEPHTRKPPLKTDSKNEKYFIREVKNSKNAEKQWRLSWWAKTGSRENLRMAAAII